MILLLCIVRILSEGDKQCNIRHKDWKKIYLEVPIANQIETFK